MMFVSHSMTVIVGAVDTLSPAAARPEPGPIPAVQLGP